MNEKARLSEQDISTKFITPAVIKSGWSQAQIREQVTFTAGRVMVRGNMSYRIKDHEAKGGPKRADFVLYKKPNLPLAIIEVKKNTYSIAHGMQQALAYAEMLDVPFVFSTNGDGFLFHDRTGLTQPTERELPLENFPTPDELWSIYLKWKGLEDNKDLPLIEQPYFSDTSGKEPYYYQRVAINRAIEAIAKGQERLLLVMATGTGKTYTAFQIIWRLWKAKKKKRILFLADRNILVDQTMLQDFSPFGEMMHKISNREVKRNYEIYLSLYQAVTGNEEEKQIYKQFPSDFFDLVVVDECHRGSAAEDASWREILTYFQTATHIGLTATPKETKDISNTMYFGEAIYTYSLRQGIDDGYLAPYKVIRIVTDKDALGYIPEKGKTDKHGNIVEQREYNTSDFDRNLVLERRTQYVARKIWEYMKNTDPMGKTIVFCDDQEHADRMRQELVKIIPEAASNRRYVMRITGEDKEGKSQLSYFIDNDEPYPVIATTSKLLTTGVDAKTCRLIVLDQTINSMTEFKQIIGRGTRIREDYQKMYFTIMDFKGATRLFHDPDFDGDPVVIYEPKPEDPVTPPEDVGEINPDEDNTNKPDGTDYEDENIKRHKEKYYISDVLVDTAAIRTQYLDLDGKLITEDYQVFLKNEIKKTINDKYGSLKKFFLEWTNAERKQVIMDELKLQGIDISVLEKAIPNSGEFDTFDLIAHIAFDQKPLTRKERANQVQKRNYFAKYGEEARAVLEALLDKYTSNGIHDIEDSKILELPPFTEFGTKTHIRRDIFGGVDNFSQALTELENELYKQMSA